jgi:hypothetical protein
VPFTALLYIKEMGSAGKQGADENFFIYSGGSDR